VAHDRCPVTQIALGRPIGRPNEFRFADRRRGSRMKVLAIRLGEEANSMTLAPDHGRLLSLPLLFARRSR
jgi:hypothetical protein